MSTTTRPWSERFKPTASRRKQRLAAALLWTMVGTGLGAAGVVWTLGAAHGILLSALLALACAVGWVKGRFVLTRVARYTLGRIELRGDGRCLGGFLSLRSWLLVATMVIGGRLLRASPLPRTILGPLYLAVGVALLMGSLTFWRGGDAATHVAVGALIGGGLGFIAGFYGPVLLAPEASHGPLLGLFITGPGGLALGAIGGWLSWRHVLGGTKD